MLPGHDSQERFPVDLTVKAETTRRLTPPSARWLPTVEVVGRETFGVVATGVDPLQ
jgi:hypothetical protein